MLQQGEFSFVTYPIVPGHEVAGVIAVILSLGRRRLMGSPAGSRRDLHDALAFAGVHRLLPKIALFPLGDAGRVLAEMQARHMSGRAVLVPA